MKPRRSAYRSESMGSVVDLRAGTAPIDGVTSAISHHGFDRGLGEAIAEESRDQAIRAK